MRYYLLGFIFIFMATASFAAPPIQVQKPKAKFGQMPKDAIAGLEIIEENGKHYVLLTMTFKKNYPAHDFRMYIEEGKTDNGPWQKLNSATVPYSVSPSNFGKNNYKFELKDAPHLTNIRVLIGKVESGAIMWSYLERKYKLRCTCTQIIQD